MVAAANAWHPFCHRRIRVEHWANAPHEGPGWAWRCSTSRSATTAPRPSLRQYDVGMEYSGCAQGLRITDEATVAQIEATGPVPAHETMLRLPARMARFLLEACRGNGTTGV